MSVRKRTKNCGYLFAVTCLVSAASGHVISKEYPSKTEVYKGISTSSIAAALNWQTKSNSLCGGYYLESPIVYPKEIKDSGAYGVHSKSSVFSQHGTSILQDKVHITSLGQEMLSDKAFIYRDPNTAKWNAVDLIGNVRYHIPNTLIVAKKGRYFFETKKTSLFDILYRSVIAKDAVTETDLTAWGKATEYAKDKPKIDEFTNATYSTCSPENTTWQVKAKHIVLNKNTGRGSASHATLYIKSVPVFYFPYVNFSLDRQRKTGFLWPMFGGSTKWGPYLLTPFYWNIAPNLDLTTTPGYLSKRGVQLDNKFRYLTKTSTGAIDFFVLPNDKFFANFQAASLEKSASFGTGPSVEAQLNHLQKASTTRKGFFWRDKSQFNSHWSSIVDFNYASDDYYLKDFGHNLNDVTENQLLQLFELNYKDVHWDFTGRLQGYQTMHPINEPLVENQYRRLPQLVMNGNYPDQWLGLNYFLRNELTHFDIRKNPGDTKQKPIGNRIHIQPGVSLPWSSPYLSISPRLQFAITQYELYKTFETGAPTTKRREVPIFDLFTSMALNGEWNIFKHSFIQTLEPQVYYTYIPYREQSTIPIFDTTVNTLTYDQIFNYNRFSGLDRIGDANQIALGMTTRLLDKETGLEKVRFGIGEILYFRKRRVTLCNDDSCSDNPKNHSNEERISPISSVLDYHVNDSWKFSLNTIWNPISRQISNSTINFNYNPGTKLILNLGFNYARSGDVLSGISTTDPRNNLKVSDVSFSMPFAEKYSVVGRWSQNWNHAHLQNLLYGIQYDTCCWAVRLVGGKGFIKFDTETNKAQYNTEFYIQFSLKGLGEIGTGDPTSLLNTVGGYESKFGQVI